MKNPTIPEVEPRRISDVKSHPCRLGDEVQYLKKLLHQIFHDTYSKTVNDALLLLTADKSQIIDANNKTEVNALPDEKLNTSDQIDAYTKEEDDALLLLNADKTELIDAYIKQEDDALLLLQVDKSELIDAYSKTKIDELFALILNIYDYIDEYSKTKADALLFYKLNITDQIDVYKNTKVDAIFNKKLNISDQIDAYSEISDDALLIFNADKTELDNYVDLTSILRQQVKNIQEQLVFSVYRNRIKLKLQFFLQVVEICQSDHQYHNHFLYKERDIVSGKSKRYVFATTDEMNTWMEDQGNVAKLAIGDNLYIVDKQVKDYQWDGTGFRVLETELPNMSIVITILGTATGGCNAITDLSIIGNTFLLAKNSSFLTTNYDETISGQKTFSTTIH
ncbi:MAG: hypothetical protein EZS28_013184 [Streblomastix strix]|uniref:Uncharacterized protein n=1 Tax=Streblomastix strix TaxID=222440 RepID=A0A5J4W9U4_9EUKA|nr:MAG: hypothetical protein EZS28_013184 [Streblomastix strix]